MADTILESAVAGGPVADHAPLEPLRIDVDGAVRRLPVIKERLEVTKRAVDKGGFRISKRVETHKELIDELLRSESVHIERCPVDVAVADDAIPGVRQEGDTVIVPVIEERLVTVKRLFVVEEVRITRTTATHRETQTHVLRNEHIEVERLSAKQALPAKIS